MYRIMYRQKQTRKNAIRILQFIGPSTIGPSTFSCLKSFEVCSIHWTIYQPNQPQGPLAALNSDITSCYQGGYFHKGGMVKLHHQLCRWDPCNCQYHRDTILDQVWVVMLKMDRLCKHPNQEHLQKCGLGMVSNPHYCCCSQSERFPRDTVCKCLCQNFHFEMFLLDMEGIPLDL